MNLQRLVETGGMVFTKQCRDKHELNRTGAMFFQSLRFLQCVRCGGFQVIKKPLD